MKICADCQNYRPDAVVTGTRLKSGCARKIEEGVKPGESALCGVERSVGECGPDGTYWVKRG